MIGNVDVIHRGSYISAHVLLNLLNELRKRDKMRGLPSILSLFPTSLSNSIIQEHECKILFYHRTSKFDKIALGRKNVYILSITQRYNGRHFVTLLNL